MEVSFRSNGLKIVGILETPKNATSKAIILAHGLTVDKEEHGAFTELSRSLVEAGFATLRFDFHGHGESEGKQEEFTTRGEVDDLQNAVSYMKSQRFTEIGILGASFGGAISVLYTAQYPTDAQCLCLWNPVLDFNSVFLKPKTPWGKENFNLNTIKNFLIVGSAKFRLGKQLFDGMERINLPTFLEKIFCPTLIIHGNKDTRVPLEDSIQYVHYLQDGVLEVVKGAEHGFHDKPFTQKVTAITVLFFQENL